MKNFTLSFGIALSMFSLTPAFAANCSTPAEVKQLDQLWQQAIASNQPDKVVNLYAPDAILLATVENKPLTTNAEREKYFTTFFSKMSHVNVDYNQELVQVIPGGAVSLGLYTFQGTKNGKLVSIPARYTFVYEATPQGCVLITHHSSSLPNAEEKS